MIPNSYTALAKFYEKIIYDDSYKTWLNYLLSAVKTNAKIGACLDVACGTGIFTRLLKKEGYKVTGVDYSVDMLNIAKQKAIEERLNINYLFGDIRTLKSLEKVELITAINDGLNYIKSTELSKAFKGFYNSLKKGGTLIFDISSKHKLKNILGNNAFGDDGDKLSYLWLNSYNESENYVDISLSIFEKVGNTYLRHSETQVQYAHDVDFVIEALKEAKFSLVSVTDGFGNILKEDSDRILFIAKK